MKKIAIITLSLLVVLLSSCDLEFSNNNSVFTDSAPVIGGTGSNGSPSVNVAGSDVVFTVRNIEGYVATSWSVTYPDRTVKELPIADSGKLVLPIPSSGSYKVLVQYKLAEGSAVTEEMNTSASLISTKVFNRIIPQKVDGVYKNTYSAAEIAEKCGMDSFYINLGRIADRVSGVTVGRTAYKEGESVKISIGMDAFFVDDAYYVDAEGNLWLNALSLYFANILGDQIIVNDSVCLDLADEVIKENTLEYDLLGFVAAHGAPDSTVSSFTKVEGESNTFDVTVRCGMETLRYFYEGDKHDTEAGTGDWGHNTGDAAEDIIIIRTTEHYDGTVAEKLGFDKGSDKGYYLNGWYSKKDWDEESKVIRKKSYTITKEHIILSSSGEYKGVFTATFNVKPEAPAEGH